MKKDIFFLLPVFTYGAGQSIKRIVTGLDSKKYNKNIICLGKCQFKKEFQRKRIRVYEINKTKLIFAISSIKNILLKNKSSQKILISNIHYTNVLSLIFFSKIKNLKIIVSERTPIKELSIYFGFFDFIKKNIIKLLIILLYKKSSKVITNSTKCSNDLEKMLNIKVYTIFSPSYTSKNIKKILKKNKKKFFLVASRLAREKNIFYLIDAINLIREKNFILKILGDGDQKEKLISYVKKLKLEKKVKFMSYKKDINQYFKESDLFINTSFFEGFPNSVVEAISNNVPVLCSKSHGGVHDIIKNKSYGNLFDINKVENLSSLILDYFKNEKNFLKKTSKAKKNLKLFSEKKCVIAYENILSKL